MDMKGILILIEELAGFLVCNPAVVGRLTKLFAFDLSSDLSKIQSGNAEQKLDSGVNIAEAVLKYKRENPEDIRIVLEKIESLLKRYRTDEEFRQTLISLLKKTE